MFFQSINIAPSEKWKCFKGTINKKNDGEECFAVYFRYSGKGAIDFNIFEIE